MTDHLDQTKEFNAQKMLPDLFLDVIVQILCLDFIMGLTGTIKVKQNTNVTPNCQDDASGGHKPMFITINYPTLVGWS